MRTYEQLSGAQGKKIYYRAERFPADLLFGKFRPRVEIGDDIFDVQDIWTWNCEGNPEQFEENVREIISKSLRGEI